MGDEQTLKEETNDLLSKVEDLKAKIKKFEGELGIISPELNDFIEKKEDFVKKEEKLIKTPDFPIAAPVAAPQKNEQPALQTEPVEVSDNLAVSKASTSAIHDQIEKVRMQSEEVEKIAALISKIKDNSKIKNTEPPRVEQHYQPKDNPKPPEQNMQQYDANDLPSLADLVKKVDLLVNTNRQISDELRGIIEETSQASTSSKLSELIRKLAIVGFDE